MLQFPYVSDSRDSNPSDGKPETVYKIFSPRLIDDIELLGLLCRSGRSDPISWVYRKEWLSYPILKPTTKFDEPVLAERLWYTGGMDNFASTMETNALMGKNVAKLIIDSISRR